MRQRLPARRSWGNYIHGPDRATRSDEAGSCQPRPPQTGTFWEGGPLRDRELHCHRPDRETMRRTAIAAAWIAGTTVPLVGAVVFLFGCCVLPFHAYIHKAIPLCHLAMEVV